MSPELQKTLLEGGMVLVAIAVMLAVPKFRARKDWWFALGITFVFGIYFEWLADTYMMVMDYNWEFPMIPGTRMPWMMAFAWTFFFGITYVLVDGLLRKRLQKLGKVGEFLAVCAFYMIWDFAIEIAGTQEALWTYYWPEELMLFGTLPITTPLLVATFSIAMYYIWPKAAEAAEGKSTIQALGIYALKLFLAWSALCMLMLTVNKLLGVMPIPLDIAYSTEPLSEEMLNSLRYRYGAGNLFPPSI